MVDPRRSFPEPPWGGPEIVHTPGAADDLMRELAPILAEDGIDLDDPDSIPDVKTLQAALDRAVERRNMELFTPVGEARQLALTTLRLYVEAIADDQTELLHPLPERVELGQGEAPPPLPGRHRRHADQEDPGAPLGDSSGERLNRWRICEIALEDLFVL